MEDNFTNTTDDEYIIENYWALPKTYHVLFACLYTLSIILSIVGNGLEVMVLVVRKRLSVDVRCSLVNLAVADIMMAIFCIPFTCSQFLHGEWFFSTELCAFIMFMEEMTVLASVLTLTAIGVDRYLAIVHPFKFQWIKSYKAVLFGVAIIWVISIGVCAVVPYYSTVFVYDGYNWCGSDWPTPEWEIGYAWAHFLIPFAIPLTILIFAYSSIAYKLVTRIVPGNTSSKRDDRHHQKTIKTINMLAAIVILFGLCWAPFHIYSLISWVDYYLLAEMDHWTNKIVYMTFHWIAMTNSFVNPIIYAFGNNDFWKDLQYIFYRLIGKNPRKDIKQSTASASTSI